MTPKQAKPVLVLYYSGSGSTETVCRVLGRKLAESRPTEVKRVSLDFDFSSLADYGTLVMGFPTYFCHPPASLAELIDAAPRLEQPLPAFVLTTCGLYTTNSVRHMALALAAKNIIPAGNAIIRGPGSDAALLFPYVPGPFTRYERAVGRKLRKALREILTLNGNGEVRPKIPRPRWYTWPQNLVDHYGKEQYQGGYGQRMRVLDARCTNCGLCVRECMKGCWTEGEEHPSLDHAGCDFCLRCIHRCPSRAIVFSDDMKDRRRFDAPFYRRAEKSLAEKL